MAKSKSQSNDLMAMALEQTESNIVKGRGSSGKTTYLDRFVNHLLDEDGNPTDPKERLQLVAEISLEICQENRAKQQEEDPDKPDFTLTKDRDTEDDAEFAETNKKVKNQVAAAIANNNNSTSVSYNDKYKNDWRVGKKGSKVYLRPVTDEDIEQEAMEANTEGSED